MNVYLTLYLIFLVVWFLAFMVVWTYVCFKE